MQTRITNSLLHSHLTFDCKWGKFRCCFGTANLKIPYFIGLNSDSNGKSPSVIFLEKNSLLYERSFCVLPHRKVVFFHTSVVLSKIFLLEFQPLTF